MANAKKVLSHFQKPSGWLGRLNLWHMNHRHSKLTDWGLQHVPIETRDAILDVGCGGGRTVQKLAAIAREGKVYGIDHSDASMAVATNTNRQGIETGCVEIRSGSVSHLPFADRMFDLVTAVETHYYWPDLRADVGEVMRVLKPGGRLILIAEAYRGSKYDKRLQRFAELLNSAHLAYLSVAEHRALLAEVGYSDVEVFEDYDKGWVCAVGCRPFPEQNTLR
jgi:ubiquinone/menaquinone biosynthesis C-methylase UbiE